MGAVSVGEGRCVVVDLDAFENVIESEIAVALTCRVSKFGGGTISTSKEFAVGRVAGLKRALEILKQ